MTENKNVFISAWGEPAQESSNVVSALLSSALSSRGFSLVKDPVDAQHLVVIEYIYKRTQKVIRKFPPSRRALVVVEPRMVNPLEYSPSVRKLFSKRLLVSRDFQVLPNEEVWEYGHLPENYVQTEPKPWLHRERLIGVVNENKFSAISTSRYKHRKNTIRTLSRLGFDVHLAGKNWDKGLIWHLGKQIHANLIALRSRNIPALGQLQLPLQETSTLHFHGRVGSQVDFLREAKFALVVENEKTYLSEKLFDALRAGCVPIYDGPELDHYGVPNSAYLTLKEFLSRSNDLETYTAEDFSRHEVGQAWLRLSTTEQRWLISQGVERLANQVCDWLLRSVNGPDPA